MKLLTTYCFILLYVELKVGSLPINSRMHILLCNRALFAVLGVKYEQRIFHRHPQHNRHNGNYPILLRHFTRHTERVRFKTQQLQFGACLSYISRFPYLPSLEAFTS